MYTIEDYLKEEIKMSYLLMDLISYGYLTVGAFVSQYYGFWQTVGIGALAIGLSRYVMYLSRATKSEEGILRDLKP